MRFFNVFAICLKTKSAPRLHEVLVCYKYVFRLGQNTTFKTCFPCRRNTHLYMSCLPKYVLLLLGRFGNYHPVQAKLQFLSMHNSCCFSKTDVLHVQQRVAPKSETSGWMKWTLENIETIGKTKTKRPKAGNRRRQSSSMPWRPPRTHVHFGRHRILQMSLRDEPGDCWKWLNKAPAIHMDGWVVWLSHQALLAITIHSLPFGYDQV